MGISNDFLKNFASKGGNYFNLADGDETQVKYLYAEEVPNAFDGGKTICVRYHLEVNGQELWWDRMSKDLALQMSRIPEGSIIRIKRTGQKSKTRYIVRRIEDDTKPL